MAYQNHHRGSTLVLSMLVLLIFLGLALSLTMEAKSRSVMTGGLKLSQIDTLVAKNAIHRHKSDLMDAFVSPGDITNGSGEEGNLRFTQLLRSAPLDGEISPDGYGNLFGTGTFQVNPDVSLDYKVYVANNPDDLSIVADGLATNLDPTLDTDGRIVLTAVVFRTAEPGVPLAVQSALIAPTGMTIADGAAVATSEAGGDGSNDGYSTSPDTITFPASNP
ncbi:hypothetical protein SCOR_26355 [Sulfidibacter corallicola]|uniref:Uncharacterized protein n=1 Tax=Sulfidibacter corallicola TaxID=2818388 RepID=A0A8A4TSR3_SULCO|nr:hypothetical protein [Sulfidibacter corallicola]QTD52081.1 hypothetical protein J3U87_06370 [Sulfidibacter corallicola]